MIIVKTKHFSLLRFNAQLLYRSDFKLTLPQNREEKKKIIRFNLLQISGMGRIANNVWKVIHACKYEIMTKILIR